MTSIQQKRAEKIAYWKPHLDGWLVSKLNMKAYCKQHDLKLYQFKYWRNQLILKKKSPDSTTSQPLNFIEVTPQKPHTLAAIEIHSAYGFHITLNQPISNDTLTLLLTTLKQLSC